MIYDLCFRYSVEPEEAEGKNREKHEVGKREGCKKG